MCIYTHIHLSMPIYIICMHPYMYVIYDACLNPANTMNWKSHGPQLVVLLVQLSAFGDCCSPRNLLWALSNAARMVL